jgi:hypothetical protein
MFMFMYIAGDSASTVISLQTAQRACLLVIHTSVVDALAALQVQGLCTTTCNYHNHCHYTACSAQQQSLNSAPLTVLKPQITATLPLATAGCSIQETAILPLGISALLSLALLLPLPISMPHASGDC